MKIKGDRLIVTFVAGEDISEGDVVYIASAGTVKKATASVAAKVVGVADESASAGENIDVVIYGKKTVTADGAISPGDRVVAASTAGRVVAENSKSTSGHTHHAVQVKGSQTAADYANFVDLYDGAGNAPAATVKIGNPGGGSDFYLDTSSNTDTVEQGRVLGKALGSASGAGDTLEILVCLA